MITSYRSHIIVGAVCLTAGIGIGLAIGYKLYRPVQIQETPKPEIVLDNGSVALERKPDQKPPVELKEAAKELGGKLERTATVVLRPKPKETAPEGCECEDITVDIGTVDQGDGKRTVVHTDDATIISGTDNPLLPYNAVKDLKWEVGVVVPLDNPSGLGPSVSRKVGPFSVGLQAMKPKDQDWMAMATFAWRF